MARYGKLGTQYFDDAGDPLISGKLYFYESGTTTAKNTFADVNLSVANTNPVILTASGRQPSIYFNGLARVMLTDGAGTQIEVRDPDGGSGASVGPLDDWNILQIYEVGDLVAATDGLYYISLTNGNQGNDPTSTPASWSQEFATNIVLDLTPQLGGDLDSNGNQVQLSKGADVASAAALPILTDGNYFDVTGTTTVTSINTTGTVGTVIKLHFDGILTLTHHATDLILPDAANIITAAGDEFEFVEYAAGDYRCTNYFRADGGVTSTTINYQEFTSSGTWTKPAAAISVYVEAIGGGCGGSGAAGATASDYASGGGGGGFNAATLLATATGATETITIGAGGAGGTGGAGAAGGNSTFGSLVTGRGAPAIIYPQNGGESGSGAQGDWGHDTRSSGGYSGGAGGSATVNDAERSSGGNSIKGGAGGGGRRGTYATGAGGTSTDGGNGGAATGVAGTAPGGGGGGQLSGTGGAGGAGRIRVWTTVA